MTYSPLKFLLGVLGIIHDSSNWSKTCPTHLDVIGAGLSKTGTQSTKMAFEALGYTVYNVESMMYYGHLELVTSIYQAPLQEKPALIQEFNARILETHATVVLDIPCNFLFQELFELNPDAVVLLTSRETPDKWITSIQKTFHAFAPITARPFSWFFDMTTYARLLWPTCDHDIDIWEPWFFPWVRVAHRYYMVNESNWQRMYLDHLDHVRSVIPSSQLVEYNVKEGWPKLLALANQTTRRTRHVQSEHTLPDFPNINHAKDMDIIGFLTRLVAYTYPLLVVTGCINLGFFLLGVCIVVTIPCCILTRLIML